MDINTKNFLTEFCEWNEHETNFYLEVYKKTRNKTIKNNINNI